MSGLAKELSYSLLSGGWEGQGAITSTWFSETEDKSLAL